MKVKNEGKNEGKKIREFYAHFSTRDRGARSSFSLPFVSLSSSRRRRRLFPTPANQVSENGHNTAPLLLALRSAAHRTASRRHTPRVFSLSLSLERGDSTRPERSACVSPFI